MNIENLSYIGYLIKQVLTYPLEKTILGLFLAVGTFFFDGILMKALVALLALIIIDFLSSVFAAYRTGEKIESHKAFRTALKITIYFGLVASARITEYTLADPLNFLDEVLIGFLAVTEFISILENAGRLGCAVPQRLLNTLKEFKAKQ